jgi:DNA primase
MVALLWERETEGKVFDSPERRAALDRRLRAILGRIGDGILRSHYETEFRALRASLFGAAARPFRAVRATGRGARAAAAPPALPTPSARASALALPSGDRVPRDLREAVILATLAVHPVLLRGFETALEMLEPRDPDHAALATALLKVLREGVAAGDVAGRLARDAPGVLDRLLADPHVRIAPSVRFSDDAEQAERVLAAEFARLRAETGAAAELADAVDDFERAADEGLTWRLTKAGEAVRRAGQLSDGGADDFGEDRAALSADLQRLIDAAVWERRRR